MNRITLHASLFTFLLALAQGMSLNTLQAGENLYQWKYWSSHKGTYNWAENRRIRLINVQYEGPSDPRLWDRCFWEATELYRRNNITYRKGGDHDFFLVEPLPPGVNRIVGWCDDVSGQGGYLVITAVDLARGRVHYTTNNGRSTSRNDDPDNYESWKIGYMSGDWGPGITQSVSIQIWKEGYSQAAAVALWYREEGHI